MKLRLEFRDIGWWYWLASWLCIAAGLAGWPEAFYAVTALAAWQIFYYARLEKSLRSFPVQVRTGFLLLMLAGLWQPLRFLYWIPAAGLIFRLSVNYCLLARLMALLPWNRKQPLSRALVRRTLLTPPVEGSIQQVTAGQ